MMYRCKHTLENHSKKQHEWHTWGTVHVVTGVLAQAAHALYVQPAALLQLQHSRKHAGLMQGSLQVNSPRW